MIQDIGDKQLDITYRNKLIGDQNYVVLMKGREILVQEEPVDHVFPTYGLLKKSMNISEDEMMYLFSVEDNSYFLYTGAGVDALEKGFKSYGRRDLYDAYDNEIGMIGYTASHIHDWHHTNIFCGRCGTEMNLRDKERGKVCPACDLVKYPQISPVVIVGITSGDKILMTKYANRPYNRYALVAGFVEVGESFEAAVEREVMEEVGLKVKNISYFASQPWGITGGLMAGYFAEVDGDTSITLDTDELREGVWLTKDEMPELTENEKSLTYTMMYEWYAKQLHKE
jgi:NAD+ diphosphatase